MYLVFSVIVTVIVLLQYLSCSFGQNIADIIMTKTMTMSKNKIQNRSIKGQFARKEVPYF